MHPALLLDEILDLVFFNLRVQRPGAGGRQPRNPEQPFQWTTLLSAALTCRQFFEPAMRHLWHDIAGLDLLLLTMGQGVVGFEFIGDEPLPRSVFERRTALKPLHKVFPKTLLTFKRAPTEEDWAKFDRYARYVKWFGRITEDWGPSPDRLEPSDRVVKILHARFGHTPILPNLHHLLSVEEQLRYTKYFLTAPKLRILHIQVRMTGPFSYTFKSDLAYFFSPSTLEKLDIIRFYCHHGQPDISPLISNAIVGLGKAKKMPKKLDICGVPLSSEAFYTAIALPPLRAVSIDVQRFNMSAFSGFNPERTFDTLDIHSYLLPNGAERGSSLERCFHSRILKQFDSRELTRFQFFGGPLRLTPQDLCSAFEILIGDRDCAKLEFIEFQGNHESEDPISEEILQSYICSFSDAFHVICLSGTYGQPRFPHLRFITLTNALVDLSDEEFDIIGQALPNLTTFVVSNQRGGRKGWPRTTLIGFWFLAQHCPNLERFSIWMNAILNSAKLCALAGLGELEKQVAERRVFEIVARTKLERMQTIDVGDSLIENSIVVTRFFSFLAPNVRSVHFNRQYNTREVNTLWAHVNSQIRVE